MPRIALPFAFALASACAASEPEGKEAGDEDSRPWVDDGDDGAGTGGITGDSVDAVLSLRPSAWNTSDVVLLTPAAWIGEGITYLGVLSLRCPGGAYPTGLSLPYDQGAWYATDSSQLSWVYSGTWDSPAVSLETTLMGISCPDGLAEWESVDVIVYTDGTEFAPVLVTESEDAR